MGAWFDMQSFDGTLSRTELKQQFQKHQDDCAYEDGHSYSGRLNMCPGLDVEDETFENYNEAAEFIQNTAQKWENAIAVRYKISAPIKSKAFDALSEELRKLTNQTYLLKDEPRIEAAQKEIQKLRKKRETLKVRLQKKADAKPNKPTKWLVGGLCSS